MYRLIMLKNMTGKKDLFLPSPLVEFIRLHKEIKDVDLFFRELRFKCEGNTSIEEALKILVYVLDMESKQELCKCLK